MNFLDIIIIIVLIFLTLGILTLQFMAISEKEYDFVGGAFVFWLIVSGFIFCASFGKKVIINYETRIGVYSTGKCDEAPVDTITINNEE